MYIYEFLKLFHLMHYLMCRVIHDTLANLLFQHKLLKKTCLKKFMRIYWLRYWFKFKNSNCIRITILLPNLMLTFVTKQFNLIFKCNIYAVDVTRTRVPLLYTCLFLRAIVSFCLYIFPFHTLWIIKKVTKHMYCMCTEKSKLLKNVFKRFLSIYLLYIIFSARN